MKEVNENEGGGGGRERGVSYLKKINCNLVKQVYPDTVCHLGQVSGSEVIIWRTMGRGREGEEGEGEREGRGREGEGEGEREGRGR